MVRQRSLLSVLIVLEVSCSSGPPPPPPPTCLNEAVDGGVASFGGNIQPLFDFYCASCHTAVHDEDFTLAPDASYGALVNHASSSTCDKRVLRVKPGDPAHSMLWLKLSADPARCNSPMPRTSANGLLADCPADAHLIQAWILAGAPNN